MVNLLDSIYNKYLECTGVSTDTRSIQSGDLFFALTGPNFNGNQYAVQAIESGAKYAIVDDEKYATHRSTVLVDDVLKTLQELANHHRKQFQGKVIALTGSNGKTTTKELLHLVMDKKFKTLATKGNLNNHIGVPLTLLRIDPTIEIAIIEMGANHQGEIAELSSIAAPDFGLITNIGEAHTETFGGIQGVLKGKTELFKYLKANHGVPFINQGDEKLKGISGEYPDAVYYPDKDLTFISADPSIEFTIGTRKTQTQLIGEYNYQNITAAISLGRYFDISDEDISAAIASYVSGNHRSQVIEKGLLKIIMDAYNANPTSMRLALESFVKNSGEKIVILADMKEVENSAVKHEELGKYLSTVSLQKVYLVGEEMQNAKASLPEASWFPTIKELIQHLQSNPIKSGYLLLKGSRSMQLDKVLDTFI